MMPNIGDFTLSKDNANTFLSRKLLKNSWHHFEETQEGDLDRECVQEVCNWEEAREVFEYDTDGLNKFWLEYIGETDGSTTESTVGVVTGIVFGAVGLLLILILVFVWWKRNYKHRDQKRITNQQPYAPYPLISYYANRNEARSSNNYETPLLDTLDKDLALGLSKCYIERDCLQVGKVITSGNFGDVWEGDLKMKDGAVVRVAVKSLKNVKEPDDVEKFLREGVIMRGLNHENVLPLIGVCMDVEVDNRGFPLIVLPFMKNGDLRTFLRDGNNMLTVLQLVKFCNQAASGMAYLTKHEIVHRDLAARNCMVDEDWCVKVADFGLSRDLYDKDYYTSSVKTQLPLKWMPEESIKYGRYNEKTDVWSYGVLCWEIMTRGAIPYPTIQSAEILQFLSAGKRMERPECCPQKLYKVMEECWCDVPDARPTFDVIVVSTKNVLRDAKRSLHRKRQDAARANASNSLDEASHSYENNAKEKREDSKPQESDRHTKTKSSLPAVLDVSEYNDTDNQV